MFAFVDFFFFLGDVREMQVMDLRGTTVANLGGVGMHPLKSFFLFLSPFQMQSLTKRKTRGVGERVGGLLLSC